MKKNTIKIIISICLAIIIVILLIVSCSTKEKQYDSRKYNKVDANYVRNEGLFINGYEISIPILVDDLPFITTENAHFKDVTNDEYIYSKERIKPYQEIYFDAFGISDFGRSHEKGIYYAYNNASFDNMAKYCLIYMNAISTKKLKDGNYLMIGENKIDCDTSYDDICKIFRDNVGDFRYILENIDDENGNTINVYEYHDICYTVSKAKTDRHFDAGDIVITMRVDKDIQDWIK